MRLFLLFVLLTAPLFANVDPEPENRSPMTSFPGRFGILLGGARNETTGSNFDWQQLNLQGGFAIRRKINPNLSLFSGVNYRLTQIDQGLIASGSRLSDLHDIILPVSLAYKREDSPWSFFASASAQLATDFKSITTDDLDWTFRLGGQYKFSEKFALNFGVARIRNFADTFILPALGFVWAPRDDWSLTLIGPRLTLSHRINDDLILRAGGFPTGGLWNVEDESGESVDYGFASYNVGLGIDFKLRRGVWLTLWGGTNFANEFRAEQNGTTLFEEDLEQGWFGYLGINLYEW